MIRITIELCPRGDTKNTKLLGTAIISNDGTGTDQIGNYNITLNKGGKFLKKGRLEGFPRKKFGVWDLLFDCLMSTFWKRLYRHLGC